MNKTLKRIIATITAGATMAAVASAFAACGENTTAEDKYLNLPDEPVIFWEYDVSNYYYPQFGVDYVDFNTAGLITGSAWIYSKTPIDVTDVEIKLEGSYFYYASGLDEVYNYQTDCSDSAGLELFMEYNGADWQELRDLYGKDKNEYSEEISNWQERYNAVKNNISLYVYSIVVCFIYEEMYNDPTKLEERGEYYANLYNDGALKLHAPETDEITTLTTATFYIGDKVIAHEFGEYSMLDIGDLNNDCAYSADGKYEAGISASAYTKDMNSGLFREADSAVLELYIRVSRLGGISETREWIDVALKDITVLSDDSITVEPLEIKYVNTLGVAVTEEWDGSERTLKARNRTAEDDTYYAFAVYYTINLPRAIPSYAQCNIWFNVTLSFNGIDDDTLAWIYLPDKLVYGAEYYSYIADDVDVLAREEVWGYSKSGDWESHYGWRREKESTFWDYYLVTGSPTP